MKVTNFVRSLTVFAALASSAALRAQESVQLPLQQVCNYANSPRFQDGGTLQVRKLNGETVEGVCYAVSVDEIQIKTGNGIVKIAKSELARVSLVEAGAHRHLALLGKHMKKGIEGSAKMIPTEAGILGAIGVPATLAYGAIAAPFCLLGDIIGYSKTVEVKIR